MILKLYVILNNNTIFHNIVFSQNKIIPFVVKNISTSKKFHVTKKLNSI